MIADEQINTSIEAQSGMCLVDEQGLIVEWSPGQEALTGLGRLEALGRSIWDVQFEFLDKHTANLRRIWAAQKGLFPNSKYRDRAAKLAVD